MESRKAVINLATVNAGLLRMSAVFIIALQIS